MTNESSHLRSTLSFEAASLTGHGGSHSCRLGQQAPRILLFPPPQSWGFSKRATPGFYKSTALRTQTQVLTSAQSASPTAPSSHPLDLISQNRQVYERDSKASSGSSYPPRALLSSSSLSFPFTALDGHSIPSLSCAFHFPILHNVCVCVCVYA